MMSGDLFCFYWSLLYFLRDKVHITHSANGPHHGTEMTAWFYLVLTV